MGFSADWVSRGDEITTEDFNFLFFNLTKGVSTMGMVLKVVGQVKGHNEKMTMTLDVEALRNSLLKSKLTSKKLQTMANKSTLSLIHISEPTRRS